MQFNKFYSFFLMFIMMSLIEGPVLPVEARMWTHKSGKSSFEAELVEVVGENIVFKKTDGQVLTLRLSDLSKKDQNFLRFQKTQEMIQKTQKSVAPKVTLPQGIRIEPVAISISRADPIKEGPAAFVKGTQLTFLISSSNPPLGVVDSENMKLECVDDVGSIVGTEKNSVVTLKTDSRGRQILVTFSTSSIPSLGAKKLILSGSIPTHVFEGKKTTLEHHVPLTKNSLIDLQNQEVFVQKLPEDDFMKFATDIAKMKIALMSEKPLHHVDQIEFFDENNEPLTSCAGDSLQKKIGDKTYFVKEFYLASVRDDFSMKISLYEKSKTMVLPVALAVDFGL